MSTRLSWRIQENQLVLSGELNHETLGPLWLQRVQIVKEIDVIDLNELARVDSAGLALLVQLVCEAKKRSKPIVLSNITDKLQTLITLYNLRDILPDLTVD